MEWWTRGRIVALLVGLLVLGAAVQGPGPDGSGADVAQESTTTSAPDPPAATTTEAPTTTWTSPTTTTTSTTTTAPLPPGLPDGRRAVIGSITDGDTFRTTADERVRLIGVDTPEVDQDQCFAAEATAALTSLVPPGSEVVLVADVEPTDRFGRTLAYVYRATDGLEVNLELARLGAAQQLTVPPNVAHADAIGAAVRSARDAGRGLWGACASATTSPPAPLPVVPPTPTPAPPTTAPAPGGACHPSYPTVCIPPPPPDLDCPQIPHRRFAVVGDDPHGFDGDRDGIGCES